MKKKCFLFTYHPFIHSSIHPSIHLVGCAHGSWLSLALLTGRKRQTVKIYVAAVLKKYEDMKRLLSNPN
jgi:hypothetical protein